jgi:hypothetical protein
LGTWRTMHALGLRSSRNAALPQATAAQVVNMVALSGKAGKVRDAETGVSQGAAFRCSR